MKSHLGIGLLTAFAVVAIVAALSSRRAQTKAELAFVVSRSELEKSEGRIRSLEAELREKTLRLAALEDRSQLRTSSDTQKLATEPVKSEAQAPLSVGPNSSTESSDSINDMRVKTRIAAIEKFVPLTKAQKEALRTELSAVNADPEQVLEQVLGKENAEYYRKQTRLAFERAQAVEEEKEILYLSRQLHLNAEEEEQFRNVTAEVEAEVESALSGKFEGKDMATLLRRMSEEARLRETLLSNKLVSLLSEEKYRRYLEYLAQSGSNEFPVWHDSGSN